MKRSLTLIGIFAIVILASLVAAQINSASGDSAAQVIPLEGDSLQLTETEQNNTLDLLEETELAT